jgi:hypothetical protein
VAPTLLLSQSWLPPSGCPSPLRLPPRLQIPRAIRSRTGRLSIHRYNLQQQEQPYEGCCVKAPATHS